MYTFLFCSPNITILASGATTIPLHSIVIFLGVSNGITTAHRPNVQLAKEGGKEKRVSEWAFGALHKLLPSHSDP